MSEAITDQSTAFAPRKPWLAVLLSLIATGVGQVYNGQWKKGILFFLVESGVALLMVPTFGHFWGLLGCVLILLGFNLYVIGDAFVSARKAHDYTVKTCNKMWVYALVICAGLVIGASVEGVIKGYFFQSFKIPSRSMISTFQVGDHFMSEILDSDDVIKRGDIVVFLFPEDESKHFVKRVIGLPGDTLRIQDKVVLVDGQALDEPYVQHIKVGNQPDRDDLGPLVIGPDEYFLMGDNREASYDSRWFGPVQRSAMVARAKYLYFPGDISSDDWLDRLGMELR